MVLKSNIKRERFTVVDTQDGLVTGFGGFPKALTEEEIRDPASQIQDPLMFTGIHILEPRVFDYIPRGVFSDIVADIYRPALAKGDPIAAHVAVGDWYELSTIPRYLDISLALLKGSNVFNGSGCSISSDALVRESIIWDDVTVEPGAELYRTIIADGVTIPAGEKFENAAIVRADMVRNCDEIPEKALKGYIQGDNYIVSLA
jgi:Nucleoside-diphosphate-sugar pyrophosphorylase involved in lipopolysaccharide biosynthesis/translation initiation factor 2B, gamma/epsilon subunits (eIF-2Bgamma/eIF-2Bepsilon)